MSALTTSADGFLLRGEPFRIVSGAMHYFRIHPGQWSDRLRKARLMGLNSVETYVPWNLHQPDPAGPLVLDGFLDLPRHGRWRDRMRARLEKPFLSPSCAQPASPRRRA